MKTIIDTTKGEVPVFFSGSDEKFEVEVLYSQLKEKDEQIMVLSKQLSIETERSGYWRDRALELMGGAEEHFKSFKYALDMFMTEYEENGSYAARALKKEPLPFDEQKEQGKDSELDKDFIEKDEYAGPWF